jgi:hypothetical protein
VRKLTRRDRVALWFAVLGGPALWAVQLALGYLLVIATCESGSDTELIGPLIAGSSILFGALVVAAGLTGLRLRRTAERGEIDDPRGRVAAMATVGAR